MPIKISEEAIKLFSSDGKIALMAVIDDYGYPHITMLSTLMAKDEKSMMFGQFCEGLSKKFICKRPKSGFLIMNVDKKMWRGKVVYTHTETTGAEFELFNEKPLFRYNSYFGIGRVNYLDLVDITEKEALPMRSIICSALITRMKKGLVKGNQNGAMNHLSRSLVDGVSTLKFISSINPDGFCEITPIVQAVTSSNGRIIFTANPYKNELAKIKAGQKIACYATNLSLESLLTKGIYRGMHKGVGVIDIEKVYNPLMPMPGYIYPKEPLKPITEFILP